MGRATLSYTIPREKSKILNIVELCRRGILKQAETPITVIMILFDRVFNRWNLSGMKKRLRRTKGNTIYRSMKPQQLTRNERKIYEEG